MAEPTSSADRVTRVLADAADDARARERDDRDDPGVPVAATVVLVRDAPDGPRVLMIERPDRGSFAGAWVFPGGKLEDADRCSPDEPEQDAARRAAVRETQEETGLRVTPESLVGVSRWDPPPGIALRIRTWFFAARAEEDALVLAEDEAVSAEWADPSDMLERHARGEVTLYPPTWVTLHGLRGHRDADAMLAALEASGLERFDTVARRARRGPVLLWQGDAEYDDAGREGASRHRLEIGDLSWRYTRTE